MDIFEAIEKKDWAAIKLRHSRGRGLTDKNAVQNEEGKTPLHVILSTPACTLGMEYYFLSDKAINTQDKDGNTPLHIAYIQGHTDWDMCENLVSANSVNHVNKQGLGTLQLLIYVASSDYILGQQPHLLESSVNFQNGNGDNALHIAICSGKWELAQELVQYADITLQNKQGRTVLHDALLYGGSFANQSAELYSDENDYESFMKSLISPRVASLADEHGYTALHVAVRQKKWKLVYCIAKHGGQDSTNRHGKTPLDMFMTEDCYTVGCDKHDYNDHKPSDPVEWNVIRPRTTCFHKLLPDGLVESLLSRKRVEPAKLTWLTEIRKEGVNNVNPLLAAIPYMVPKDFVVDYLTVSFANRTMDDSLLLCVNGMQFMVDDIMEKWDALHAVGVLLRAGFELSNSVKRYLREFTDILGAGSGDEEDISQFASKLDDYNFNKRQDMSIARYYYDSDAQSDEEIYFSDDETEWISDDEILENKDAGKQLFKLLRGDIVEDIEVSSERPDTITPELILAQGTVWMEILIRPKRLVEICCVVVRNHLVDFASATIDELAVPAEIKNYISLRNDTSMY